ncbi:MAG: hypothetical protein HOP28_04405 [Gemmatimonadales bacterium]|nr:hypothetical protein [Gemmatimonadales bacterium]
MPTLKRMDNSAALPSDRNARSPAEGSRVQTGRAEFATASAQIDRMVLSRDSVAEPSRDLRARLARLRTVWSVRGG